MKVILTATAAVILLAAVPATAGPKPDASVLMKADAAFSEAAAKGLDAFLTHVADDVATLRPNKPVVQGKKAFGEEWAGLLTDPSRSIRWQPMSASISDSGDLGYTVGSYEITKKGPEGAKVTGTGKYVTIWRKQADGSWKVAFDSGVHDAPPAEGKKE